MRRFRRSFRRSGRKQVLWFRGFTVLGTVGGTNNIATTPLFGPALFSPDVPLGIDERWTLRRLKLNLGYVYSAAVRVPDSLTMLGCSVGFNLTGADSPLTGTGTGVADYMDIWTVQHPALGVGQLAIEPLAPNHVFHRDIRAMRKLQSVDFIAFNIQTSNLSVAQDASFQWSASIQFSALLTRTGR